MDEERIRNIIPTPAFRSSGELYYSGRVYLYWTPGDDKASVDGRFTADELEAIAAWMRLNGPKA